MSVPLPVRTLDMKQYVREHESAHPKPKSEIPQDPKSRWFKKDPMTECVDACRYELFKTAEKEGLQPDCLEACKERLTQQQQ